VVYDRGRCFYNASSITGLTEASYKAHSQSVIGDIGSWLL
jgi:hypothetical protein